MRVLVVGATGVLGRNVVPRLLEAGHEVRAVVRRPEQGERLAALGVEACLGDILDAGSLAEAAPGCDAALHLATAIPVTGASRDWSTNDRIRREGTRNLLDAARKAGIRRYVQQSIVFLYGDRGAVLTDESAPLAPAPYIQSAADMEAMVEASGLDWVSLRGGLFYGPGTGAEQRWEAALRSGDFRLPGDGAALQSLVHVVDMARAVMAALERAPGGTHYNAVDNRPVSYRELFGFLAARLGLPPPAEGGRSTPSLACSNRQLRAATGWTPAYPSYRSGLAEAGREQ